MSFKDFPFINDPTPIAIITILDKYLNGWYSWEPETLREEIPGPLTEDSWSTIFASAATVNQARDGNKQWMPWSEADIFGDIAVAFQGIMHIPNFWQKPTLNEIWFAIKVLRFIDPKENIEDEVAAYIACCLIDNDIYALPFDYKIIKDKIRELIPEQVEDVSRKAEQIWNNARLRSKAIARPVNNPVNIQILRMEAARELVDARIQKGVRQIKFIG